MHIYKMESYRKYSLVFFFFLTSYHAMNLFHVNY